jgi:peptidoglycan/xylan/chitin deacetylase (PgdA/CDA1 family)
LIDRVAHRALNLTFHGIGEPTRPLEDGEAGVWVPAQDFESVLAAAADRPDVHITFDDGNASDVGIALPALVRRGLSATFFIVAGRIGTPGFLDAEGVRALRDAGMAVGSHGMRHRRWRQLPESDLHEETVVAKQAIEDVVGSPVTAAACPFGAYDRRALATLRSAGYARVYTSDRGLARTGDWLQVRNTVHAGDDGAVLDRISSAGSSARRVLAQRARVAAKRMR